MRYSNKFFLFLGVTLISTSVFAAPTITLTPPNQAVTTGQKATVKIVTTGASSCNVSGGTYNKNNTLTNGNILLTPANTTTYTFECFDIAGGSQTATTVVTVNGTQATTPTNTTTNGSTNNTGTTVPQNQATAPQYGNQTIMSEANSICTAYSSYQGVYSAASAGGGSSVPVDLTQLRPVLEAINKNTKLSADELRQADLIRFCRELPNMAAASNRLAQDTAKELKHLADNCYADEKCFLQRVYDADVQREVDLAVQRIPVLGRQVAQLIIGIKGKESDFIDEIDFEKQQKCVEAWKRDTNPIECWRMPSDAEVVSSGYFAARNRILTGQAQIYSEFERGAGIIGSRPCVKTFSGADPTNLFYKDRDCADYKLQPQIINQEVIRQITSLPYTQAYSEASILGPDQSINNINTRIRNGNLVDPDISSNLGSIAAGGSNPNGGGIVNGTDMKSVEPNYNKILSNIDVITTLYDVTRAAYASSTSVCKVIPVETRNLTIQRIDSAKQTYVDYKTTLTAQWEAAKKTPNENHLNLVTQINFDLKDKYNQSTINQVYDAVKALLQACVDASASISTS